jgi:hypothetical protein
MRVEYQNRFGEYKVNIYDLWNIRRDTDDREMKVQIMRSGGGVNCTITLRRSSVQEGSEITMTHSEQHIAGLREVYHLYKEKISSGKHYNSLVYKDFNGYNNDSKRERIVLSCEIKMNDKYFVPIEYKLEATSIALKAA